MKKLIIGVMGPGKSATEAEKENAFHLGQLIAQNNWILVTGGRNWGVMEEANRGAKSKNGLTVGVLPDRNKDNASHYVDIPIITGMGSGRNIINVLSADIVIACGIGSGTASEIALALKENKKVILLTDMKEAQKFFKKIGDGNIQIANNIDQIKQILKIA